MCLFCADIYGKIFSFRSVQLWNNAEIWVRLMPGISCAGEGRSVLVSTLLHITRIPDANSYNKLTEAVTFFVYILVVPVWNVGLDWTVCTGSLSLFFTASLERCQNYLNHAMTASFQTLSNSVTHYNPNYWQLPKTDYKQHTEECFLILAVSLCVRLHGCSLHCGEGAVCSRNMWVRHKHAASRDAFLCHTCRYPDDHCFHYLT
jgi:hypothetical protein